MMKRAGLMGALFIVTFFFTGAALADSESDARNDARKRLEGLKNKGRSSVEEQFLSAVASGDRAKVEQLIREGVNVNAQDGDGQTGLMYAAMIGNKAIADMLIAHGADVNSKSKQGTTPLMAAIISGHKEIVKLLLEKGADANASAAGMSDPAHPMTSLFMAIGKGDLESTKLLIEKGADVNRQASDGQQVLSPLAFALKTGRKDIAQLLTSKGAKGTAESSALMKTQTTIEEHIKALEARLAVLCKDAGETIYKSVENVEGIYIHVPEKNPDKVFGYYHEDDRHWMRYLSPTLGSHYRFWEMDSFRNDGVIEHHSSEVNPTGKLGEKMIESHKELTTPEAAYGITWKHLTNVQDQRQGLYGDELTVFNVKTKEVLAVRKIFFYVVKDTTLDASGQMIRMPGSRNANRFGTCTNYNPGQDDSYTDLRPRNSYKFVSKVLRPKSMSNEAAVALFDLAKGSGEKKGSCVGNINFGPGIGPNDLQLVATNPRRGRLRIVLKATNDALECDDILNPAHKHFREVTVLRFYDGNKVKLTDMLKAAGISS